MTNNFPDGNHLIKTKKENYFLVLPNTKIYHMVKKTLIKKTFLLFLFWGICINVFAQSATVSGVIYDSSSKEPLPGVTIAIEGKARGTITRLEGKFSLQADIGDVLIISFLGYKPVKHNVTGTQEISIMMEVEVELLGEVIAIGYGTVKREDATGAVTAVSSRDFNQGAITSPQELLMGKASGVTITTNSGEPGAGSTIRIRGGSSLTASNDPLIVVDGVPMNNENIDGMANSFSFINPNDIETFTILKDASSTAIYGSRASNGVIIITTKGGTTDKMQISYNGSLSMGQITKKLDVLNADEYRTLAYEKLGSNNITSAGLGRLGSEFTDWQDEVYRVAVSNNHNISVSGKVKNAPYRASAGYTKDEGVLKNTNMDRFSGSINTSPSFLDGKLNVKLNARGSFSKSNFGNTGAVSAATEFDPTQPVRNGNKRYGGYFTWTHDKDKESNYNQMATSNPVAQLELTNNTGEVYRGVANAEVDYEMPFMPGLKANVNVGIDASSSKGNIEVDTIAPWTRRGLFGELQDQKQRTSNELFDFYLNYKKDFDIHSLDVTGGYSWQHFYKQGSIYRRSIEDKNNPNASKLVVEKNESYKAEYFLVSFFGRVNYKLSNKYLLTATLRNDGSSKFIGDNQWGLFPSAAFAWSAKQEAFLENVDFLSQLKLRLSWGITGQQDITDNYYPALGTYRRSSAEGAKYQIGVDKDGKPIFSETMRPNAYDPNIKWEEATTYNIGLDFGFLRGRINGSVELYKRVTDGLINYIAIPNGSNFSNFLTTNVGNMENKGIELNINAVPVDLNNLTWRVGLNISHNKNEITKLTRTDDPDYIGVLTGGIRGGTGNTIQIHSVGQAASSFFVLQQVYGEDGKPLEGVYVNRSGETGSVKGNYKNYYHYKSPAPDMLIGITNMITYKDFDFSFAGRISIGNYAYNNIAAEWGFYGNMYLNNFWRNLVKSVKDTNFDQAQYMSDYYVENASFFRMDNMSLGYNFAGLTASKIKGRLSFTVQNAFVITNYSGLDPEVGMDGGSMGIDKSLYPRPRTFLLGLNLDF